MRAGIIFRRGPWLALLALAAGWAGCDNMERQTHIQTGDPMPQLPGRAGPLHVPAHTVANGPQPDPVILTGRQGAVWVATPPLPITLALLRRGQERFDVHCAVCHGADGYGTGIVPRRGFPPPPSLHRPDLRALPAGQVYDVITHGFGVMYPAGFRIAPADRWAIVAYVRALQFSQSASLADVPAAHRADLAP